MSYKNIIYVLPNDELRNLILRGTHRAMYMAHSGVTKMKADLKPLFFKKGMKADIVIYVMICLECQLVKVEHRHLTRLVQSHVIL